MSASDDGPVASREVAYRLFAAEYDGADLDYSDSDEERAPNYVVTPTGARVNRLFVVGVLTEVEPVSDDVLRARVSDPTGAFVIYAGQYQPEAVAFLETADVPSFVAVTGKARTFRPEDSERVFTSVRPESVTTVDAATRDRWTVQAAAHTLARVATMAEAIDRPERGEALTRALEAAGVAPGLASGTALAIDHYGTAEAYLSSLRELALAAAEVAIGDRESAPSLELKPDDDGHVSADLTNAPAVAGTLPASNRHVADDAAEKPRAESPAADETTAEPDAGTSVGSEPEASTETAAAAEEDTLGDFTAGDVAADEPFELDDEAREAVEAEFETEFSPGSEVGDPGEAGIKPETGPPATEPSADPGDGPAEVAADPSESPSEEPEVTAAGTDDTSASAGEDGDAGDEPVPESSDLEDAVIEAMGALDDGDGVERAAVVTSVVESTGAADEAVEEAIQDALMGGRCYEPSDGRLKAI